MITFFYSTGTCSTAIHIALEEAGIPFKGIEVSWQRKLNIAELEAVNPMGQVPVIVDEGRTLTQSIAILEWIANNSPGKNLLPEFGTWERTQAMGWLAFLGADLQKSFGPVFRASKWTNSEAVQAEIKKATRQDIEKHLALIDKALNGRDFLLGKHFSVVDAFLFTIVGWCKWSEVKIGKYSNLSKFMRRVDERPTVQTVLNSEGISDYIKSLD